MISASSVYIQFMERREHLQGLGHSDMPEGRVHHHWEDSADGPLPEHKFDRIHTIDLKNYILGVCATSLWWVLVVIFTEEPPRVDKAIHPVQHLHLRERKPKLRDLMGERRISMVGIFWSAYVGVDLAGLDEDSTKPAILFPDLPNGVLDGLVE